MALKIYKGEAAPPPPTPKPAAQGSPHPALDHLKAGNHDEKSVRAALMEMSAEQNRQQKTMLYSAWYKWSFGTNGLWTMGKEPVKLVSELEKWWASLQKA